MHNWETPRSHVSRFGLITQRPPRRFSQLRDQRRNMNGSRENQEPDSQRAEQNPSGNKKGGRRTQSREAAKLPVAPEPGIPSSIKVISRFEPMNEFIEDLQTISTAGFFG